MTCTSSLFRWRRTASRNGIPGGSDTESGQSYVTDKELEFIVGADFDGTIATAYGVNAYPKTYFLDKDLNLVSQADYLKARGIKDNLQAAKK